jgi:hypothetical protein
MWRRELSWKPWDLSWRAGGLFMVGSMCFALGAFPPYFDRLPAQVVGITFFVGSIFFTSAGLTQLVQVVNDPDSPDPPPTGRRRLWAFHPERTVWWAIVVQIAGMLFFNINTFRAAFVTVTTQDVNRLVWAPDFFGSIAFLIASHLAWWIACGRLWCIRGENADWWIAALNYLGSIFFMLAAIGAYTLPATGSLVDVTWANGGTFFGAVCFFAGAYLLLPSARSAAEA